MGDAERDSKVLACAKAWVESKGWTVEDYRIHISELQSCPDGFVSVDATCVKLEDSEDEKDLLKRSRVLEIDAQSFLVAEVLAARDAAKLRRILDLERVLVKTEEMERKLQERESDPEPSAPPEPTPISDGDGDDEESLEVKALLLEQDPVLRLTQLEQEIERVKLLQKGLQEGPQIELEDEEDEEGGREEESAAPSAAVEAEGTYEAKAAEGETQ